MLVLADFTRVTPCNVEYLRICQNEVTALKIRVAKKSKKSNCCVFLNFDICLLFPGVHFCPLQLTHARQLLPFAQRQIIPVPLAHLSLAEMTKYNLKVTRVFLSILLAALSLQRDLHSDFISLSLCQGRPWTSFHQWNQNKTSVATSIPGVLREDVSLASFTFLFFRVVQKAVRLGRNSKATELSQNGEKQLTNQECLHLAAI